MTSVTPTAPARKQHDITRAATYTAEAAALRVQAVTLAHLAAEIVDNVMPLHDSSPKRRAGLALAHQLRQGANELTEAAEEYEMWAADYLRDVS